MTYYIRIISIFLLFNFHASISKNNCIFEGTIEPFVQVRITSNVNPRLLVERLKRESLLSHKEE